MHNAIDLIFTRLLLPCGATAVSNRTNVLRHTRYLLKLEFNGN